MSMDALKNLTTHIPGWLTRLDDVSGQIEQRQAELAAIAAAEHKSGLSDTRSLRNKGSTESLKPKDDGPSNIPIAPETFEDVVPRSQPQQQQQQPEGQQHQPAEAAAPPPAKPSTPTQALAELRGAPASPGAGGIASAHRPQRDAVAAAHSRARAQIKKRIRSSSSMVTADNTPHAYRTRSMIIVYYDSYVQGFFDELVRYVSSSRNLIRKAKMAARVAQIRKMAEAEISKTDSGEENRGGDGGGGGGDALPSLRYMSSRRLGGISRTGLGSTRSQDKPDAYDNLDKVLESVQCTCEHGAHQFLRDADCNDEIKKIQKRLRDVLDMAGKETERVLREEPELAKESGDLTKPQTARNISIRRDLSESAKEGGKLEAAEDNGKLEVAIEPAAPIVAAAAATDSIEVDTNPQSYDEGIDVEAELPKLHFRSTRSRQAWVQ